MVIIGTGGLASDILSSLEQDKVLMSDIVFYNDTKQEPIKYIKDNFTIINNELDLANYFKNRSKKFIVGVGDNLERLKLSEKFEKIGGDNSNYISTKALVGKFVKLPQKGLIVMHHSVIGNGSELGEGAVVYVNSSLGHQSIIGSYTLISGQVCMSNCQIGDFCFLGIGTTIKPGISIGNNVITGIGAVVVKNISEGKIVHGNPAKPIN